MARSKGFGVIEVIVVIVVIVLVCLLGWRLWMANQETTTDQTDTSQGEEVPMVDSAEDLDKVQEQLDATNLEGTEQQQLDTETNF